MRYLHTMVRVSDLDKSLEFYCGGLGLQEIRRRESEKGRFTLVFLAAPGQPEAQVELTYNWDPEDYGGARNFGHLAYEVEDIYAMCSKLRERGVTINRPPRDGHMAFVRSPDNISIELLQKGDSLPPAGAVGLDGQHRHLVGRFTCRAACPGRRCGRTDTRRPRCTTSDPRSSARAAPRTRPTAAPGRWPRRCWPANAG